MWEKVQETVAYIQSKIHFNPDYAVILGSGLGSFTEDLDVEYTLPYRKIPNFPVSTVSGHKGALVFGSINGRKVIAMQGRFHYYEGYSMDEVTFPVRVFKALGVKELIVSNAAGGVNPTYRVGDIVVLSDLINMFPAHPLRGANDERFGPRFVNMSEPFSRQGMQRLHQLAFDLNIEVKKGVYLGLQGPTFETLAEYRMVRILGGDCVGMSTVPEVIVARHMDLPTVGISVITDIGSEEHLDSISHEEVLQAAQAAEPHVRQLIKTYIAQG